MQELYHYGVKGMKWRHHKPKRLYTEEYNKEYKSKEEYLKNRTDSGTKAEVFNKYNKAFGDKTKPIMKYSFKKLSKSRISRGRIALASIIASPIASTTIYAMKKQ